MEDQPAPAGAPCFIPPSEFYFTAAFRFYLLFFCFPYGIMYRFHQYRLLRIFDLLRVRHLESF